jgi:acyl-CoA reductase-like NAD-dependent aldehyde dehydrogenase
MPSDIALRAFHSVDPSTGDQLETYTGASPDQLDAAVRAAAAVHRSGALADPQLRARLLRAIAAELRDDAEAIVALAKAETGLPDGRLNGELERTWRQLQAFADVVEEGWEAEAVIDTADADWRPVARPDLRRMLVPLGPVAMFGASNFPLAFSTAGGDTAAALAAGCPVVVKGHRSHPGTGERVAAAVTRAVAAVGLPAGTFTSLHAAGRDVGEALVAHPDIAAVAFTGSYQGGIALQRIAQARPVPIPVFAEMGSNNPLVVTAAALAERGQQIADGLALSVTGSGGQLCTKPGIVFVPEGEDGERLIAEVGRLLDETEPPILLNATIHSGLRDGLARLDADRVTSGDEREQLQGCRHRPVAARARAAQLAQDPELLEERFGPFVLLATYADDDELIAALEALPGQLTATLHAGADEHERSQRLGSLLTEKAGRVLFDGFPTGVAVTWAMQHGGPYPATTDPSHTSVGMTGTRRFMRPVTWQSAPAHALPPQLRDDNPCGIWRRVNGELTQAPLPS